MSSDADRRWQRRDLVRAGVRAMAVAAGALVAVLATRRPRGRLLDAAGQTCGNRGICGTCPTFAGCGLPQALSQRQHAARSDRHG